MFDGEYDEDFEMKEREREMAVLEQRHYNVGYQLGRELGETEKVQDGFNEAFRTASSAGYTIGRLQGIVNTVLTLHCNAHFSAGDSTTSSPSSSSGVESETSQDNKGSTKMNGVDMTLIEQLRSLELSLRSGNIRLSDDTETGSALNEFKHAKKIEEGTEQELDLEGQENGESSSSSSASTPFADTNTNTEVEQEDELLLDDIQAECVNVISQICKQSSLVDEQFVELIRQL